jgi:hypothetical protein
MGKALGSDSPHITPPAQTSAPQNTSTGSGSRPGSYKMTIDTSAPSSPHEIRPPPPGALK